MKCPEVRQKLYLFLDNELDIENNLDILTHLDFCPDCNAIFENERSVEELLKEKIPREIAPKQLWDEIRSKLHAAEKFSRPETIFGRKFFLVASTIAATLIMGAGIVYYLAWPSKVNADTLINQSVQLHQQALKGQLPTETPEEIEKNIEKNQTFLSPSGLRSCQNDLSKLGYSADGACMTSCDPLPGRRVALVIYHNGPQHLSHFILRNTEITFPETAFRRIPKTHRRYYFFIVRPYKVIVIRRGNNLCLFVGNLRRDQISALVEIAAKQVLSLDN